MRSKKRARRGRQRRKSAVGAVHVQPEIVRAREIGDCADRVDRAGRGGPGAGDDAEGQVAGGAILAHQAFEIGQIHAQVRCRS